MLSRQVAGRRSPAFLLTCHQIHNEAAPLFYSTPVFQETWNPFAKLIGPENLFTCQIPPGATHPSTSSWRRVAPDRPLPPSVAGGANQRQWWDRCCGPRRWRRIVATTRTRRGTSMMSSAIYWRRKCMD
ncbi:hypothetical protein BDBG_17179 [Blastomyces gilchristii SLH14081]|uniref:Uncharacterized protein n=1 Tax=Blastomyces gilchristii (strain SLH14081) TaxID=559298 RepID=A0A179UQB4_BLAGS|nr:uncharacterized protein BDBG_17179 [Blastomyces gilchristii SLH14081]OAT09221.1 hypothetical protein BDBG_17179 [Blastomyces gilchristii SLH14081]